MDYYTYVYNYLSSRKPTFTSASAKLLEFIVVIVVLYKE